MQEKQKICSVCRGPAIYGNEFSTPFFTVMLCPVCAGLVKGFTNTVLGRLAKPAQGNKNAK